MKIFEALDFYAYNCNETVTVTGTVKQVENVIITCNPSPAGLDNGKKAREALKYFDDLFWDNKKMDWIYKDITSALAQFEFLKQEYAQPNSTVDIGEVYHYACLFADYIADSEKMVQINSDNSKVNITLLEQNKVLRKGLEDVIKSEGVFLPTEPPQMLQTYLAKEALAQADKIAGEV